MLLLSIYSSKRRYVSKFTRPHGVVVVVVCVFIFEDGQKILPIWHPCVIAEALLASFIGKKCT